MRAHANYGVSALNYLPFAFVRNPRLLMLVPFADLSGIADVVIVA